ncbi:MAG: cytochrome c oxidase subunit 3 [Fimbriiglobus sp.]
MFASATAGGAPVAHHFNNLRQQQATVRLGMWLFLVTEVLFFGGAICAYTCYRIWFPREFEAGSAALNVGIASVNTFLLLTSSLTMTLAIRACYFGNPKKLQMWLGTTIILGTVFLGLKAREYHLDYEEGLIPTAKMVDRIDPADGRVIRESAFVPALRKVLEHEKYEYVESGAGRSLAAMAQSDKLADEKNLPEVDLHKVQLFFMFYYCMTGLHVIHMIVGIGLIGWQFVLAKTGFFDHAERYVYIEVLSLYWHFVDMVWMFILPLLYLAGPHSLGQAVAQFHLALGLGGH